MIKEGSERWFCMFGFKVIWRPYSLTAGGRFQVLLQALQFLEISTQEDL
jgi:hypothetical protein